MNLTTLRMAPVAVWLSFLFIMSETYGADTAPGTVRNNQTTAGLRPIRLAIGGFAGPAEGATTQRANAQLLDLLTVKLGGTKQIELVERTAMERVLKEITLSASQSARTVAAGKLLRADWLLLGSWIRVETTNHLAVRLVDARTAVILDFASVTFADPNVEQAAQSIAGFVQSMPVTSSSNPQWVLLGIGGFENLGIRKCSTCRSKTANCARNCGLSSMRPFAILTSAPWSEPWFRLCSRSFASARAD